MRVLLISDHADPLARPGTDFNGGQNVYVRGLATSLAAAGCAVDVATRWESPELPDRETIAAGARLFRIQAGLPAPLPRDRFGDVLAEFSRGVGTLYKQVGGYDVVHSHYWYSGQAALRLSEQHGVPVVHTYHSLGAVRRAALARTGPTATSALFEARHDAEQRIAQRADALVVSCPSEAHDLRHLLGAPVNRMHLVPPGLDASIMRPIPQIDARAAIGVPPNIPVVLFLGRLERRKGWEELLGAFSQVRRHHPQARLLIVGGNDKDAVALVERHGLASSVELHGSVPHDRTALYYSAADVTAVPSHYEPFGLVAIESMACGTPVVATRVGGLSWTVGKESVGVLVPVHDQAALGNALRTVLRLGRDHFHRACLDHVSAHFTTEMWINGILDVYRAVRRLDSTARPPGARKGVRR